MIQPFKLYDGCNLLITKSSITVSKQGPILYDPDSRRNVLDPDSYKERLSDELESLYGTVWLVD